jgi:heat shock protein HslJ
LPAGATPAADLAGRWVSGLPVTRSAGTELAEPFVEVAADGTWTGSDGCNGAAGAWRLGPGGRLLATIGSTTAMACEGAALPYSLAGASRASVDGSTLTVFDSAGSVLGTLTRG